jgi:hypothetical protein
MGEGIPGDCVKEMEFLGGRGLHHDCGLGTVFTAVK